MMLNWGSNKNNIFILACSIVKSHVDPNVVIVRERDGNVDNKESRDPHDMKFHLGQMFEFMIENACEIVFQVSFKWN